MRCLALMSIVALLGVSACAEYSGVPEAEMQKSYGRYGADDFSRRGY